jgi:hypothetical protein
MQQDGGASALAWIERSALATAMRQELWLYPSVEIIHIWGFVMLVGCRSGSWRGTCSRGRWGRCC